MVQPRCANATDGKHVIAYDLVQVDVLTAQDMHEHGDFSCLELVFGCELCGAVGRSWVSQAVLRDCVMAAAEEDDIAWERFDGVDFVERERERLARFGRKGEPGTNE